MQDVSRLRARGRHGLARRPRAGFALLEVLLASFVLVVAIVGLVSAITSSAMLGESSTETTIANQGAQQALERILGSSFSDAFTLFNLDPNDDPGGVGTAPGANFVVAGLDVQAGDADGMVGIVEFPVTGGPPGVLREDLADPGFGMPRDLSGDGVVDAANHAADYIQLPVRVRVEWTGLSGERAIELETILCER